MSHLDRTSRTTVQQAPVQFALNTAPATGLHCGSIKSGCGGMRRSSQRQLACRVAGIVLILAAVCAAIPSVHAATDDSLRTDATMLNDLAAHGEQGMNKLLHWALGGLPICFSCECTFISAQHPPAFTNCQPVLHTYFVTSPCPFARIRLERAFKQLVYNLVRMLLPVQRTATQ